jgi:hypothetical protein
LTGRLPFVSTNAMELVRMHRDDKAPSVADFRTDAPAPLESLCAASLAKDPADRPADGGALVRELRGTGGDATVIFTPEALPNAAAATQVLRPTQQPPRRGRRVLWIAPLVVALVGGGIALALVTTGGDGATPTTGPLTGLSLPTVSTAGSTKPKLTTTAPSTTEHTTTAPTTTAEVTTSPVTTRPATTAPVTSPPTVLPTTTVAPPPTTTSAPPTTTAPGTTDTTTTPTTTAPAPAATTTP